jgi:hypothetical protein
MLGLYLNLSILNRSPDERRSTPNFTAYLARSARMVAPVFAILSSMLTPFMWFQGLNAQPSCFIKPCAPHSIKDWDQAFALLSGLTLFVYEAGPDIAQFTRERTGDSISRFLNRGAQ